MQKQTFSYYLLCLVFRGFQVFMFFLSGVATVRSDEGMWLLNEPPRAVLKEKHQFELTDAWLDKARLSSVRLNSGGSGSFVSSKGLLLTNHHVGADALRASALWC